MNNPLEMILQQAALKTTGFAATSRYYGIDTATHEAANENTAVYLRRRFVPAAKQFFLLQEHTVVQGDRLDNIAHHYLGDPEQFWRICDANNAMMPDELTETPGKRIRITLPEGIPGGADA